VRARETISVFIAGIIFAAAMGRTIYGLRQWDYDRHTVDHMVSYVNGKVHTNGLENFWSLLKRALKGTYVNVEPFHLFRYLDEQAFRFNDRKNEDGDSGRFVLALQGVVGKGFKYAKLIAAEGGDGPCPP
jgi:hypothetical protein